MIQVPTTSSLIQLRQEPIIRMLSSSSLRSATFVRQAAALTKWVLDDTASVGTSSDSTATAIYKDTNDIKSTQQQQQQQQQSTPHVITSHHDLNDTTITSTVHIRVTPRQDHMFSWSFLWAGFFLASAIAAWQVYREHKLIKAREEAADMELAHHGGNESVSSADKTRCTFRRLLLLALLARLISMPVMVWSQPLWLQFVGDTLPEMIFATAWTLMVTFFVQLVGSATGTVTNTDAGLVIQATAYIVYSCLIVLELFNSVASVLLYALLCCIYAALLGAIAYFCPKLWSLLQPSLLNHGALVVRLYICTMVCVLVFAGHMVGFALIVIAAPKKVYWWVNYGIFELVPATIFLFLMSPTPSGGRSGRESPDPQSGVENDSAAYHKSHSHSSKTPPGGGLAARALKRVDSLGSAASHNTGNNSSNQHHHRQHVRQGSSVGTPGGGAETSNLLRASPSYGSTADAANN